MKKSKLYQDEQYLRHMYYELQMLPSEIAKFFHVTPSLIYRYFRKFGIQYDQKIDSMKHRKYHCDYSYFDIIDTPTKAYWLGFIMADGSIEGRKDRANTYRLILKLAKRDQLHLEKFNQCLSSDYHIDNGISIMKGIEHEHALLRIGSSVLCHGLIQNGIPTKKSCHEIFPKNCMPKVIWKDFIRGVFDGDGCFSWFFDNDRHIPCCSFSLCGSELLLQDCFSYINECIGINIPKITKRPDNELYTATIGGNFNVIKIMNWLYSNSISENRLDRKYNKYQEFLTEYNHPKYNEYKRKSNVYT